MRHQYTPVFREFTTSSMWAESPATRCVWLYLLLHADPEGFVPGTLPGLSVAANVALDDTRKAVEKFLSPDPDSNSQAHEGRRLEKVPHGWRILNFEYWRDLARREAEKARKRRWINARRRAENDDDPAEPESTEYADDAHVYLSTPVDASSEKLDAPKPKPKPKPKEEEESPLPPAGMTLFDAPLITVVQTHTTLDGMDETGLEDEAVMTGMSKEWFRERLLAARNIRIGGASGVRDQREWVRQQFGRWKTWEEEGRAKSAQRSALAAAGARFGASALPVDPIEPAPKHEAFAREHGLDLQALLQGVLKDHPNNVPSFSRLGVLGERLRVAAKQKRAGHPVTGKLTRSEFAEWGPVPPGGALPEVA